MMVLMMIVLMMIGKMMMINIDECLENDHIIIIRCLFSSAAILTLKLFVQVFGQSCLTNLLKSGGMMEKIGSVVEDSTASVLEVVVMVGHLVLEDLKVQMPLFNRHFIIRQMFIRLKMKQMDRTKKNRTKKLDRALEVDRHGPVSMWLQCLMVES